MEQQAAKKDNQEKQGNIDEKALLAEGWNENEIRLAKDGWERKPIYHYNRFTQKHELTGYSMVKPYVETYEEVSFMDRSGPNDPPILKLKNNDKALLIPRGEKYAVPRSILNVADEGKTVIMKQDEEGNTIEGYTVQAAKYVPTGKQCTEQEYKKSVAEGNKKLAAAKKKATTI